MIELRNTSRWYGEVIGLNDVSCDIGPGITALLGMNGAGKSTLMKLVTGQIRPTTGTLNVFGMSPFGNPDVFRMLGYCPEIDNFYEHMSGREFVRHMARLVGLSSSDALRRTEETLERVGMKDRAARKIAGYSKGMRQRIKLAQAMLHDPQIILLDEPLNGLDPVGRREFMDVLQELSDGGKTIVISSHILFEVEQMTSAILVLHRGRLLASGDVKVVRDLIDKYPHRIRLETSDPRALGAAVAALPYVVSMRFDRDSVEVQTREPDRFYAELPHLVLERGVPMTAFSSPDNNLEAVFGYLVES